MVNNDQKTRSWKETSTGHYSTLRDIAEHLIDGGMDTSTCNKSLQVGFWVSKQSLHTQAYIPKWNQFEQTQKCDS